MRSSMMMVLAAGVAAGVAGMSSGALYTPGNLVVSQVGPGFGTSGALNSAATAVTLREFGLGTPKTGSFLANDLLLASGSSDPQKLTVSGSATSEGVVTRSTDGRYLTVVGYNAVPGSTGVSGGSIATSGNVTGGPTPMFTRTVAAVGMDQSAAYYDIQQSYSNSNIRSAVTATGSSFYLGGTSGTSGVNANTGGVRLLTPPVTTPVSQASNQNNVRVVNFDTSGRVMASAQSSTTTANGIFEISGGTANQLPGFNAASLTNNVSITDFWFKDATTLYAADEGTLTGVTSSKNNVGGLQKWIFDGTNWNLAARFTGSGATDNAGTPETEIALTSGLRGLTGTVNPDGSVTLYAITGDSATKLVAFVDDGTATISTPFYQLAVAGTNQAFRGVDFAPIPAPGAAALLGLGGAVAARRRRR